MCVISVIGNLARSPFVHVTRTGPSWKYQRADALKGNKKLNYRGDTKEAFKLISAKRGRAGIKFLSYPISLEGK